MLPRVRRLPAPLLLCLIAWLVAGAAGASPPAVVVLRTEYVTVRDLGDARAGRLLRELGRQAVLIAVRDELGAVTRDQTLAEIDGLGDVKPALDLLPRVRTRWPGLTELSLEQADGGEAVGDAIAITDKKFGIDSVYPTLAIAWEAASRTTLKDRLVEAGLTGETPPFNADNRPDEQVAELLGRMNFVSQWEAVSRAHAAIAAEGPSVEWLTVLARGYTHLGTLTDHHWTGTPEAFYARALLYAERARALAPDDANARWLRPYALAMCGAHGAALKQMEELDSAEADAPAWAKVIDPIGHFDALALKKLAASDKELRPLVLWSSVGLRRTLGSHASFYKDARESLESDPDAYGAYSALVTLYSSLGDQRYGASVGPMALGKFVLTRLEEVHDLPEGLRKELPRNEAGLRKFVEQLKDNYDGDSFLPTPNFVIQRLREADAAAGTPREPSWSSLASLVAEEQFVMAVNACTSMHNATETDLTEPVRALAQLVEGHRYAAYVQSCSLPSGAPVEKLAELIGDIEIVDPRHNMRPMLWAAKRLPRAKDGGLNRGYNASWDAVWSHDYRLPSMAEDYESAVEIWSRALQRDDRWFIKTYQEVSPHAPHWLRRTMYLTRTPTPKQLEEWDAPARKDYRTSRYMAGYAESAGQVAKAAEWLENAYELEPDASTAIQLATLYRSQDQQARWLPTLRRYLDEQENRGLEHSGVQVYIARTLMREDRDYAAALPYAEEAAETFSASSLATALEANEGLARWEEADHYAKALSTSYPSSSGEVWYLFRRRTGHGDPEEAKPLLEYAFVADKNGRKTWTKLNYLYVEGDLETAFKAFHTAGVMQNQIYSYRMSALVAKELGDDERVAEEVATVRGLSNKHYKEKDPAQNELNQAYADLLEKGELAMDAEALQDRLKQLAPLDRSYLQFSLGAALQVLGVEPDLSDELLYEAATAPEFDNLAGNLAGHFLVRKYGRVRNDPIEPPADE